MSGWYRQFVPNFATLTVSMTKCLKKNKVFQLKMDKILFSISKRCYFRPPMALLTQIAPNIFLFIVRRKLGEWVACFSDKMTCNMKDRQISCYKNSILLNVSIALCRIHMKELYKILPSSDVDLGSQYFITNEYRSLVKNITKNRNFEIFEYRMGLCIKKWRFLWAILLRMTEPGCLLSYGQIC